MRIFRNIIYSLLYIIKYSELLKFNGKIIQTDSYNRLFSRMAGAAPTNMEDFEERHTLIVCEQECKHEHFTEHLYKLTQELFLLVEAKVGEALAPLVGIPVSFTENLNHGIQ